MLGPSGFFFLNRNAVFVSLKWCLPLQPPAWQGQRCALPIGGTESTVCASSTAWEYTVYYLAACYLKACQPSAHTCNSGDALQCGIHYKRIWQWFTTPNIFYHPCNDVCVLEPFIGSVCQNIVDGSQWYSWIGVNQTWRCVSGSQSGPLRVKKRDCNWARLPRLRAFL